MRATLALMGGGVLTALLLRVVSSPRLEFGQLALLVMVLIGAAWWGRRVVPMALVVGVAGATAVATVISVAPPARSFLVVPVAQAIHDSRGGISRALRHDFQEYLRKTGPVRVVHHHRSVSADSQIRPLLTEREPKFLWWGDGRFSLSSWVPQPLSVREASGGEFSGVVGEMRIITDVSLVQLPELPRGESLHFLAAVLHGVLPPAKHGGDSEEQGVWLREAATFVAPWRTGHHRAYAWFLLGTHELRAALARDGEGRRVHLRCALRAFERGRGFVRAGHHPELFAALLNNQAVAEFIARRAGVSEARGKKVVKKLFEDAFGAKDMKGLSDEPRKASLIAGENAALLVAEKSLQGEKKAGKRKKHARLGKKSS